MLRPRTPRREQLGDFLTTRRRALSRTSLGLPPTVRRSDIGLSREEVSTLAGVSSSWYTWLEQGRDINVSRQVLLAVARVLQLTSAEADYVLALAEPDTDHTVIAHDTAPSHLTRLIDSMTFPAFIVATDWTIAAWNEAYAWLYPPISDIDPVDRNLLWLIYTDARLRELLPDWERTSRSFLAEFRTESGVRLSSPAHRAIVDRLREASDDFRGQWAEHAIERFTSRRRQFRHPESGMLEFEHHRLVPSDAIDLHVVLYVPVPEQPTLG